MTMDTKNNTPLTVQTLEHCDATLELGLSGSRALAERLATSAVAAITYTAINQEEEQPEPPQEMEAIA